MHGAESVNRLSDTEEQEEGEQRRGNKGDTVCFSPDHMDNEWPSDLSLQLAI